MNQIQFKENQFLGSGSFSNVYKVSIKDQHYALKKIHSYLLKDPLSKSAILKQIEIMKQIDHPCIIKFYDCIQTNENEINLLLEYAQGGNLYTQLKLHQKLSQPQTIRYLKEIIKAIKYLHSRPQPILHRDIKPENILLTKEGHIKLADFGSSNILDEQRNTFVGTKEYMAPEIIENKPYGKEIDLWCLGILIYEMLTGDLPKYDNEVLTFPPDLSRPAEDLIKRLLRKDPSLRMTLEELENHIWLAQEDWNSSRSQNKSSTNLLSQLVGKRKTLQQRLQAMKKTNEKKRIDIGQSMSGKDSVLNNQSTILQSSLDDNERIQKSSQLHLRLIQYRAQLKIKLQKAKKLILLSLNDFSNTRLTKVEQIYRLEEKIKEYENNIELLVKKYPLKFKYQYENRVNEFLKKVDYLQQYVEYFPTKLQEEVGEIPEVKPQINTTGKVIVDQSILKMENYVLQSHKQALIQLITAKKRLELCRSLKE